MTDAGSHIGTAFALGFALGAAPGPVQVLILSETAKRGFTGGLRVMLGANGTLLAVVLLLALGLSSRAPGPELLGAMRLAGGGFLVYVAISELRSLRRPTDEAKEAGRGRSLGPTAKGVTAVIVNPAAWIFFATTASAVLADATTSAGRSAAILAALAMGVGVSASDILVTSLGSGGRALLGEEAMTAIRAGLSVVLAALGVWLILQGVRISS
jgi:threonine/homoserine/homoserine lactone efflux protein